MFLDPPSRSKLRYVRIYFDTPTFDRITKDRADKAGQCALCDWRHHGSPHWVLPDQWGGDCLFSHQDYFRLDWKSQKILNVSQMHSDPFKIWFIHKTIAITSQKYVSLTYYDATEFLGSAPALIKCFLVHYFSFISVFYWIKSIVVHMKS